MNWNLWNNIPPTLKKGVKWHARYFCYSIARQSRFKKVKILEEKAHRRQHDFSHWGISNYIESKEELLATSQNQGDQNRQTAWQDKRGQITQASSRTSRLPPEIRSKPGIKALKKSFKNHHSETVNTAKLQLHEGTQKNVAKNKVWRLQ